MSDQRRRKGRWPKPMSPTPCPCRCHGYNPENIHTGECVCNAHIEQAAPFGWTPHNGPSEYFDSGRAAEAARLPKRP